MARLDQTAFPTVKTEGGLLPPDFLARVRDLHKDIEGLAPTDYHLTADERLNEEINDAWNHLTKAWTGFADDIKKMEEDENLPDAGPTRQNWLLPLFRRLDYGQLQTATAIRMDDEGEGGKEYPVSHAWQGLPIHLVGWNTPLDKATPGARGAARVSPHGLMQELLNRSSDHLWGIVSNGKTLRLMRDNISLTRQAYVEFDLAEMMNGHAYADFQLLWLLCHQSRFEGEQPSRWWIERWKEDAQQRGARAREDLRKGVEKAIKALGSGFLKAPNTGLKDKLRSGELSTQDFYRQLLRLVYRLMFLFVAEDRELLHPPLPEPGQTRDQQEKARSRYAAYYSTTRLRALAERPRGTQHVDLWRGLCFVMKKLRRDGCEPLALPALGSFLWDTDALRDLARKDTDIPNRDLLVAVRHLSYVTDRHGTIRIDYKNMGSEELGSVYESLLELHPDLNPDTGHFALDSAAGHERKTTGSYYTPDSLVQRLLDSALDPVMDAAVTRKAPEDAKRALLNLKVCDPASGSGHFLIAATHRIAARLASIESGEEEASPAFYQTAVREVVRNCIYGVDKNPFAVELCKVSLWMEALDPGKPLNFLDHRIRHGDSLVGVLDTSIVEGLIPNDAYNAVTGDDKEVAKRIKAENRATLKAHKPGQALIRFVSGEDADIFTEAEEDTLDQVEAKEDLYREWLEEGAHRDEVCALNVWTAGFFVPLTESTYRRVPTSGTLVDLATSVPISNYQGAVDAAAETAERLTFFHWTLEFPDVFAGNRDGFDVVLSNPPWERIKLQDQEFFAGRDLEIAQAPNKAARDRLIRALRMAPEGESPDPSRVALADAHDAAKHDAEAGSLFARKSGRFPLGGVGDVNTYALFAELGRDLISSRGRTGIVVPTGIATDNTYREFFADLNDRQALVSLYDFENRKKLFDAVDGRMKFSLLTMAGSPVERGDFAFYLTEPSQLDDAQRRFTLTNDDFARINPNTKTCPIFRTHADAELAKTIYDRVPILVNEETGENPWDVKFLRMFDMSNDSHLFRTRPGAGLVPLYEAKMVHQYDHRFGTYEGATQAQSNKGTLPKATDKQKADPDFELTPRYWVTVEELDQRLRHRERQWLLGFRDIARATDVRTMILSPIPRVAVGHKLPLVFLADHLRPHIAILLAANLSSLVLDYLARQKVGGTQLSYFILNQLPVLPPDSYGTQDASFIAARSTELIYTSWDMAPFACDVVEDASDDLIEAIHERHTQAHMSTGSADLSDPGAAQDHNAPFAPFPWSTHRRAIIRAELDAYYARLYGLTEQELRYILDPEDVYGEDFPGETFRVLKNRDMRDFGEYRTKRLVLEAWDRLQSGEI
jgi:hypothetical protein